MTKKQVNGKLNHLDTLRFEAWPSAEVEARLRLGLAFFDWDFAGAVDVDLDFFAVDLDFVGADAPEFEEHLWANNDVTGFFP